MALGAETLLKLYIVLGDLVETFRWNVGCSLYAFLVFFVHAVSELIFGMTNAPLTPPKIGGNRIVQKLQSPPELGDLGGAPS